jgi:hypothetical protein
MNDEVFYKYLEIKQDLINNLKDVFNRQHYYTHKYRGNIDTDINVVVDITPERNKLIQIFVRHNKKWIRDKIVFNDKGILSTEIRSNLMSYE